MQRVILCTMAIIAATGLWIDTVSAQSSWTEVQSGASGETQLITLLGVTYAATENLDGHVMIQKGMPGAQGSMSILEDTLSIQKGTLSLAAVSGQLALVALSQDGALHVNWLSDDLTPAGWKAVSGYPTGLTGPLAVGTASPALTGIPIELLIVGARTSANTIRTGFVVSSTGYVFQDLAGASGPPSMFMNDTSVTFVHPTGNAPTQIAVRRYVVSDGWTPMYTMDGAVQSGQPATLAQAANVVVISALSPEGKVLVGTFGSEPASWTEATVAEAPLMAQPGTRPLLVNTDQGLQLITKSPEDNRVWVARENTGAASWKTNCPLWGPQSDYSASALVSGNSVLVAAFDGAGGSAHVIDANEALSLFRVLITDESGQPLPAAAVTQYTTNPNGYTPFDMETAAYTDLFGVAIVTNETNALGKIGKYFRASHPDKVDGSTQKYFYEPLFNPCDCLDITLEEYTIDNTVDEEALAPVVQMRIDALWMDVFNDSGPVQMMFNVALNDATKQQVSAEVALYKRTTKTQVEFVKSQNIDIDTKRPMLIDFGTLPQGNYSFSITYELQGADGQWSKYPDYDPIDKGYWNKYVQSFAVVPTFEETTYSELFKGYNKPGDPNRFNLVFNLRNVKDKPSMTLAEMKQVAIHLIVGKFGLIGAEPFRSHVTRFNFWIMDQPIPSSATSDGIFQASSIILGDKTPDDLNTYRKMVLSFPHGGGRIVPIQIQGATTVGGRTCGWVNGAQIEFPIDKYKSCLENGSSVWDCLDMMRADRVFTHELAHVISGSDENYVSDYFFDHNAFVKTAGYTFDKHWSHYATYYSPEMDSKNGCVRYGPVDVLWCAPNDEAIADCETNSGWHDLIGNGCGEEGIIDCTPEDPLYKYEVTCENMGSGRAWYKSSDLFKPTQTNIMDNRGKFLDVKCESSPGNTQYCDTSVDLNNRVFGQPGERQICVFLDAWGSAPGGVCKDLCLDTCAQGERCISGQCVPAP
jgi:hypothetical protein